MDKKHLFEINSTQELSDVIEKNKGKLILDFTSPVCPPCRMLEPVLERLVQSDICSVAKINVFENQEIANNFNISATPTIVILNDSDIKKAILGYKPFEAWVEILEKI